MESQGLTLKINQEKVEHIHAIAKNAHCTIIQDMIFPPCRLLSTTYQQSMQNIYSAQLCGQIQALSIPFHNRWHSSVTRTERAQAQDRRINMILRHRSTRPSSTILLGDTHTQRLSRKTQMGQIFHKVSTSILLNKNIICVQVSSQRIFRNLQ